MKHNIKIIIILLAMFFVTQLIGLLVVNSYSPHQEVILNETTGQYENITITPQIPYGFQPPAEIKPSLSVFFSLVFSLFIAVALIFLLMRIRADIIIKIWFFLVIIIALTISFNSIFNFIPQITKHASIIALVVAIPLAIYKVFKRNILVHNLTELLIYPGLATVFVPILNIWLAIAVLLALSAYDIYAVWHSGFMQKMAKFQINKLKIFAGFFVPYMAKKEKDRILALPESKRKGKKVKVSLAILGGGDVVFPIIAAGVVLRASGFLPALLVSIFATIALLLLFIFARKGKFYPAMPFLTAGILVGIALGFLI